MFMKNHNLVGISHLDYQLPKSKYSLNQLEKSSRLISSAKLLSSFGFKECFISDPKLDFFNSLISSSRDLIKSSGLTPAEIDYLILYSGYSDYFLSVEKETDSVLQIFRYPVSQAQELLGLQNASSFAVSQQGCGGLFSTINIAYSLLNTSNKKSVLSMAYGLLPSMYPREVTYNLISDAVGSMLIQKNSPKNQIIHFYQESKPYYWDSPQRENEIIASYFPVAQRAIQSCLSESGVELSQVRWIVPHNVSLRSWKILSQLIGFPENKVWTKNISRIGHTISCDQIINLSDMEHQNDLRSGDLLLLFTFGFGANWSCVLLKH